MLENKDNALKRECNFRQTDGLMYKCAFSDLRGQDTLKWTKKSVTKLETGCGKMKTTLSKQNVIFVKRIGLRINAHSLI